MSITAMKQALEALEKCKKALAEELSAWDIDPPLHHVLEAHDLCDPAVTVLRQAIEQAEKQEPVAYINVEQRKLEWAKYTKWDTPTVVNLPKIPLYTTPQPQPCPYIRSTREGTHHCALSQREWVGLTDEELELLNDCGDTDSYKFAKAIEAKLKEKNT